MRTGSIIAALLLVSLLIPPPLLADPEEPVPGGRPAKTAQAVRELGRAVAAALAEGTEAADEDEREFLMRFAGNLLDASWLARYDVVAWVSGDEVMAEPREVLAKLGRTPEWWCVERDDGWHAVYGRLDGEEESYARIIHHRLNGEGKIGSVADLSPRPGDVPLARAFRRGMARLEARPEWQRIRFNPYLRQVEDGVEFWAVPQVAQDWTVVCGITVRYSFGPEGREFRSEKVWDYGIRGIRPDPEKVALVGDPDLEAPTPGDLFTILRFGDRFMQLGALSRFGTTLRTPTGLWTHLRD